MSTVPSARRWPRVRLSVLPLLIWVSLLGPAPAAAESFLWRFEGEENVVYLLGAVHVLQEGDATLPPAVEEAYRAARKVVFETDLGELESVAFAQRLVLESRLPEGTSIEEVLSPETYGQLLRTVEDLDLPPEALRNLKPAVVAFSLVVPHLRRLGLDPELGVDARLWRRAKADGKERGALETPEFQLSLLTGLPLELQEQLLSQTLDEMDTLSAHLSNLLERWRNGDVEGMTRLLGENFREYPEVERVFLTERNRRWVTRIEAYAREAEDVLVVVGAGHLVGYDGVVELLRVLGHRVERR